MKKYFSTLLLGLLGFTWAQAQVDVIVIEEQEPIQNIVKLSPFHFVDGTFLLAYERMLTPKSSLMIQGGLHSKEGFNNNEPSFGFQEEIQFRQYFIAPKNVGARGKNTFYFKGMYAGPYLFHRYRDQVVSTFDWVSQENVLLSQSVNEFSGGVVLGAQFALGNAFYFDIYTGGGVKKSWGRNPNQQFIDITSVGYNGVLPKAGFLLGIGF